MPQMLARRGVVVVAILAATLVAALAAALVVVSRRLASLGTAVARLEERTARSGGAPATTVVVAPGGGSATDRAERLSTGGWGGPPPEPAAEPKMPEARALVEDLRLAENRWRALLVLNQYWLDSLAKAGREGEGALPDGSLARAAEVRELKFRGILRTPERIERYREFERSLHRGRVQAKGGDGRAYEGVPFE